jgi:lipopolysaccharide biosynthesis glycosyltransferase
MSGLAWAATGASARLLRQVSELLAADDRQAARCLAQAVLDEDRSDQAGHVAAAMVAAAEGYDELALHHLRAVHDPAFGPWLAGPRFLLACRGQGDMAAEVAAVPAAHAAQDVVTLERWIEVAVRHSCHAAALNLVRAAATAGHLESTPALARWRSGLEALQRALAQPNASGPPAPITFVALPPFARPVATADGVDWVPAHWRQVVGHCVPADGNGRVARWLPGFLRQRPSIPPIEPMDVERSAFDGQPAGGLHVVLEGRLDAGSLRHWLAFLKQQTEAVIVGLQACDPDAMTPEAVAALRRHEPIGAADEQSLWLLTEFGMKAYRSAAASAEVWQSICRAVGAAAQGQDWNAGALRAACQEAGSRDDDAAGIAADWEPAHDVAWQPWVDRIRASQRCICPPVARGAEQAIHLALAVDGQLAHALPVVIESALEFSSRPLQVHVLGRSLAPSVVADWRVLFEGRAGIELFDCGAAQFASPTLLKHTTVSTLDRLLLPALLPDLSRAIYLDVDLLVCSDLAPLWAIDLQGHPLAAKPSSSPGTRWGRQMLDHAVAKLPPPEARQARRWLRRSGPMAFRAFNAGVLVMDLARMRSDNAVGSTLAWVAHLAMNDQDALNTYARGGYVALDVRWNAAPRQDVIADAAIIHFVGPLKPWGNAAVLGRRDFLRVQQQVARRLES